jgi:hypothetical protein
MSRGIHSAAQPLTILLASLAKDQTDRMSLIELRELATRSAMEVGRVCTIFNFLRESIVTESVKPQLSEMPVYPLVAHVTEGFNLLFERDGMFLKSTVADSCRPVMINRERTLQAISRVVLIAHGISHANDTVELTASSSSSHTVKIIVRNVKSYVDAMSEEASLSMVLADANTQSQQGRFLWSLKPFGVQFEFDEA